MKVLRTASYIAYKTVVRGHKSTLILLIFILSLSFLNLMFITGILTGLSEGIAQNIVDTSMAHITISPQEEPTRKDFIAHQRRLRAQIATIPGVVGTVRRYEIGATIAYDKEKNGKFKFASVSILGIDPEEEPRVLTVDQYIVAGRFLDGLKANEIVLASGIAGGYGAPAETDLGGAKVGDKVQVTYSNQVARTYTVRGIFHIAVGTVANSALISAEEAESVLSVFDNASRILVKVDTSRDTLDNYYNRIQAMAPALKMKRYTELLAAIGTILTAFDLITYIVSAISILVATVTIFVLIYVNAVTKRRQIGILKAIGVKENVIVYSYVFQSLFYALSGVVVGSVLVFLVLEPWFKAHPLRMPVGSAALSYATVDIVIAVASLLAAGFLGGLIPARIVAREDILKAIWG